ncbi:MAG: ABC transporter substrate-binding protein [Bacteroidota bacterium]
MKSPAVRLASFLLVLHVILPAHSEVRAQPTRQDSLSFRPDVEKIFVDAMRNFTAERFDSAAGLFMRCIREFPFNHRTTGAYIMGGKAYYRLGNYRESVRVLKNYIDLHPESGYISDAHYTLGLNFFRMLRSDDAAEELIIAHRLSGDALVLTRSERLLDDLAGEVLTIADLQLLLGNDLPQNLHVLLSVRLAERLYRSGDIKTAQEILLPVAALPPEIPHVDRAVELLRRVQGSGVLKVGVVLPLMMKSAQAAQREVGVEIYDGIKLAAEEYNQVYLPKINLEVRDSERDPGVTARVMTELCSDEGVVAIIGPIFSNEAFAGAGIANARGVPVLTPTATANGIASIGPYVFQLNADLDTRGRAMARYAFERGDRRFAVLSPVEQIPKSMADAFVDEVARLGGEIIDQQWYQRGATDLRMQLSTMRRRALDKSEPTVINFATSLKYDHIKSLLMAGVEAHVLDSLMEWGASVRVEDLLGPEGKQLTDSLRIPTERALINYDSLGLPVVNVDAMFLPIASADEIGIVTSQLRYFNFQTKLLGTGEWNDLAVLDMNREYANEVVYSYDTAVNESDPDYRAFAARFQKLFSRRPSVNALYGYDAMKLLMELIARGTGTRNDIAAAMTGIRRVRGWHTSFSIDTRRVNTFLTLFQYQNRSIRKIDEIDLLEPEDELTPHTTR